MKRACAAVAVFTALSAITAWLGVNNLASVNVTMAGLLAGPVLGHDLGGR